MAVPGRSGNALARMWCAASCDALLWPACTGQWWGYCCMGILGTTGFVSRVVRMPLIGGVLGPASRV